MKLSGSYKKTCIYFNRHFLNSQAFLEINTHIIAKTTESCNEIIMLF